MKKNNIKQEQNVRRSEVTGDRQYRQLNKQASGQKEKNSWLHREAAKKVMARPYPLSLPGL